METAIIPDPQVAAESEEKKPKRFLKLLIVFLILVAAGVVIWFVGETYINPEAKQEREAERNYEKYIAWEKTYEDAMRQDTYGGKTPEETLRMFIDALKKGDIDLASKYFMLDTNEKSPNYLTRREVEKILWEKQKEGEIERIKTLVEGAISNPETPMYEGDFGFSIKENGEVISSINMRLNKFSNVWKIESF